MVADNIATFRLPNKNPLATPSPPTVPGRTHYAPEHPNDGLECPSSHVYEGGAQLWYSSVARPQQQARCVAIRPCAASSKPPKAGLPPRSSAFRGDKHLPIRVSFLRPPSARARVSGRPGTTNSAVQPPAGSSAPPPTDSSPPMKAQGTLRERMRNGSPPVFGA